MAKQMKNSYKFTSFENSASASRWIVDQYQDKKTCLYHEHITDSRLRKLHFDIEGKNKDATTILESIFNAIKEVCKLKNLVYDPFVLSASNDTKLSIHVILNGTASTHHGCLLFAKEVSNKLDQVSASYIDMAIYTSSRNMRMMLCDKKKGDVLENRVLLPVTINDNYELIPITLPDKENLIAMVNRSIITNYDESTKMINVSMVPPPKKNIESGIAKAAYELYESLFVDEERCYEFRGIFGSLVDLKRFKSGPCRACLAIHDRIDAFLVISGSGNVSFRCYKDKSKNVYLGKLDGAVDESSIAKTYLNVDIPDSDITSEEIIHLLVSEFGYILKGTKKR